MYTCNHYSCCNVDILDCINWVSHCIGIYHKCSLFLCNDNKLVEVLMKFEEVLCAIMHCELKVFILLKVRSLKYL